MKFLTRIKIFFRKIVKFLMPVSNIEKLKHLLTKQTSLLEDTRQKYYNSKGKEDYYQTELNTNTKLKEQLLVASKKAKEDDNKDKLRKLFDSITMADNKIKMYTECLEKQKNITVKLNSFVTVIEDKLSKLRCDIEMLKTKEDFSSSVKDFRVINNSGTDINIDDIIKDIEINYNAKSYEFDDVNLNDISLELKDDLFEDFVNGL